MLVRCTLAPGLPITSNAPSAFLTTDLGINLSHFEVRKGLLVQIRATSFLTTKNLDKGQGVGVKFDK